MDKNWTKSSDEEIFTAFKATMSEWKKQQPDSFEKFKDALDLSPNDQFVDIVRKVGKKF